jgi:poly-gamma-glutamate capsule biosynthesis protein CapA/YwtB (metallophosphatase superfamily)
MIRSGMTTRYESVRPFTSAIVLLFLVGPTASLWAQPAYRRPDTKTFQFRDLTRELANKMTGTYVVAVAGDVNVQQPVAKLIDPKLQQILRDADTAVGNLETTVLDLRDWPYGLAGNFANKDVAADLAALGFDLMTNANNHSSDMREEGLKSSIKWMDAAGIPLAGIGPNLATARLPVFQQTPKGRVGMIGATTPMEALIAADRQGNMGGTWGLNPLGLTQWDIVTPEQLKQLKAIRDSIVARRAEVVDADPIPMPIDQPDRVQLFRRHFFMAGPKPGEYHYEMNKEDLAGNLIAIRNTKEYSDFAIFTLHNHEVRYAFTYQGDEHYPPPFVIDFAHALIDNGADMFFGHGAHAIKGIEIYKGRPIFYGPNGLICHQLAIEGSQELPDEIPAGMTPIEADEPEIARLYRAINLVGYLATAKYQDGKLVEVRIYPMDLGADLKKPWSRIGLPQTPSPEMAQRILAEVQRFSEPFGTKISIENGVGVIRVPPEATVPVGQDIRSTFPKSY